ncbi:hypothetical protein [Nocardia goodfellowii]|uniref:Uncharacterized protein n=1 Tax=Nocardia goodfellowii TaxID=882446 RepID=A0ABS4QFM8_9NOCA|nr:hypothetical protein [Nocardia goodfellowii]MBP2190485.1 hypothetical protein [Nocardia goodfellowii]
MRITQYRNETLRRTGWRYYVEPNGSNVSMPGYLAAYLGRMLPAAERLPRSPGIAAGIELITAYGRHRSALL